MSEDPAKYEVVAVCESNNPLISQVGGDHYSKLAIQPMEYSVRYYIDACHHSIIKYFTRFRNKGGIEDLRKARHCIDLLIKFETDNENQG